MNLDNSIMGHANISIKFYYLFFLAYDKCIVNHKYNSYFSFSGSTERNLKQKGTKQPCKFFPNCRFGISCRFQHPPCKFGARSVIAALKRNLTQT